MLGWKSGVVDAWLSSACQSSVALCLGWGAAFLADGPFCGFLSSHTRACKAWQKRVGLLPADQAVFPSIVFHLPPSTLHVPFSLWPRFYPTNPQKGSSVRTTTYLDDLPHFWGPFIPKCCPLIALPHFIPCSLPTPILPWGPHGGSHFHAAQAQHWSGSWMGIFMFKFYSTSGNFPNSLQPLTVSLFSEI